MLHTASLMHAVLHEMRCVCLQRNDLMHAIKTPLHWSPSAEHSARLRFADISSHVVSTHSDQVTLLAGREKGL
jgi:hypothetical protein